MNDELETRSSGGRLVLIVLAVVSFLLLVTVLACAGIVYLGTQWFSKSMASVMQMAQEMENAQVSASAFLDDLAAGRVDVAYQSTSEGFQKRQTREEFRDLVSRYPLLTKGTSRSVEPRNIGPTICIFEATIKHPNGNMMTGTVHVIKEGERWRVDRFTVP